MMTATLFACILHAAHLNNVPPALIYAIRQVEGGKVGEVSHNTNGTYDIGPMQINSIWLPKVATRYGVNVQVAQAMILHNECVNVEVGAWILADRIKHTGDVWKGAAAYHSYTPKYGTAYLQKVYKRVVQNFALQQKQLMSQKGSQP